MRAPAPHRHADSAVWRGGGAGGLGLAEFADVIQKQVHGYILRKLQRSVSEASRCVLQRREAARRPGLHALG